MAGIGLRKPFYAIYNNEENVVTYSDGGILAKAIEFSASIEGGDDESLHADDAIAENMRTFAGGTLSITTDDLTTEASAAILGIKTQEVMIGADSSAYKEMVYDDSTASPYLGFAVIIPKQKNGKQSYRALVFPKIMFSLPEESAVTKGDKVEWKTPTIEGTIFRSDAVGSPWKREVTVPDEATAVKYIKQCLQIIEQPITPPEEKEEI